MIRAALHYASLRWSIFPCSGKQPLTQHGFREATADETIIRGWWERWPRANVGWSLPPRWFAVDEDPRKDGTETRQALEHKHGALPPTLRQRTGSAGYHWIFRAPEGVIVRQGSDVLGPGLDTRVSGKGYLLIAPSIHPETLKPYAWDIEREPAMAPAWLLEKVGMKRPQVSEPRSGWYRKPSSPDLDARVKRARAYVSRMPVAVSGSRGHDATFRVALVLLRGFELPEADALDVLREYNATCTPPWSERELAHKVKQAAERARVPYGYIVERGGVR